MAHCKFSWDSFVLASQLDKYYNVDAPSIVLSHTVVRICFIASSARHLHTIYMCQAAYQLNKWYIHRMQMAAYLASHCLTTCCLYELQDYKYSPTIGTPTKYVRWSETMNTLFQTAFMANPVIGSWGKCLHSRLAHLIVTSYIVVNSIIHMVHMILKSVYQE